MQGKVPVGVTSVAGYTITLAGAIGAILAFLKGDRSDQTLGVLASAGVAVLAFLSTQLGRYAQAHAAVKKPAVQVPSVWTTDQARQVQGFAGTASSQLGGRVALATKDEPGESAPPEASLYPLTDPTSIPPDEGDSEAEGSA